MHRPLHATAAVLVLLAAVFACTATPPRAPSVGTSSSASVVASASLTPSTSASTSASTAPPPEACFAGQVVESATLDASGNVVICAPSSTECVVLTKPPALVARTTAMTITKDVPHVAFDSVNPSDLPAFKIVGARLSLDEKDRWADLPAPSPVFASFKWHLVRVLFINAVKTRALVWRAVGSDASSAQGHAFFLLDLVAHKVLDRSEGCVTFTTDAPSATVTADAAERVVAAYFYTWDLEQAGVLVDLTRDRFAPIEEPEFFGKLTVCKGGVHKYGRGWVAVFPRQSGPYNGLGAISDDLRTRRTANTLTDFGTGATIATLSGYLPHSPLSPELILDDTTHAIVVSVPEQTHPARPAHLCVGVMKLAKPEVGAPNDVTPSNEDDAEPNRCVRTCAP